ncbi:MAG: aldo/keto reductase [Christensenellales bacterium]
MKKMRLGRTELQIGATGFGALPIQRVSFQAAEYLLRRAVDGGIDYFDTARMYTDSEEKMGRAFRGMRDRIYIATKSHGKSGSEVREHLEASLRMLETDYIDVYQCHNPAFVPVLGGDDGIYDVLLQAKEAGKIRHIGITSHSMLVARQAVDSGLYDTLQFPFSCLSTQEDIDLVRRCQAADMGFVAMKALSGGLIGDARAAFAYIDSIGGVLPIWGVQKPWELEMFLELSENPPEMDEQARKAIAALREELSGEFCRGCGYCLPCPADINIPIAARMGFFLQRAPVAEYTNAERRDLMGKVADCTLCGVCESRCPYHLQPYKLVKKHAGIFWDFVETGELPKA